MVDRPSDVGARDGVLAAFATRPLALDEGSLMVFVREAVVVCNHW